MAYLITATCASILGILALILAYRVSQIRRRDGVGLGDAGNVELGQRIRVHANLVEFAPLALILLLILEQTALPRWLVLLLGAALVIGRLMHAWGLSRTAGYSVGRFYGSLLTWGMILITALLNLYVVLASLVAISMN